MVQTLHLKKKLVPLHIIAGCKMLTGRAIHGNINFLVVYYQFSVLQFI